MRIITVGSAFKEPKEYKIYENEEEFAASGESFSKVLHETAEGQYYRFDNGIYAPLLKKAIYHHDKKATPLYEYTFPKMMYMQRGTKYRIGLQYSTDSETKGLVKGTPRYGAKDIYFVKLLSQGVAIDDAFKEAYKRTDHRMKIKRVEKVLFHPKFEKYINKEEIMSRMKVKLEEAGVTEDYLAAKFKEIMDDPKANASLKQYAIEKSFAMLKIAETAQSNADTVSVAERLRLIGQAN